MRGLALILVLVICCQLLSSALDVDINIPEKIYGFRSFFESVPNIDERPQSFLLSWENQGSVPCRTIMRVDISYEGEPVYSGWSREETLEPGDYAALEAYYYPPYSGNYSANVSVYYCNLIEDAGTFNFSARVTEEYQVLTGLGPDGNQTKSIRIEKYLNQTPITIETENTENTLELHVRSNESFSDLVFIPRKYPAGWIFPGAKLDNLDPGSGKTVNISYEPSVFRPAEIEFDVATMDGKIHAVHKVTLKEKEDVRGPEQYVVPGLSAAVIILLILLVLEKRRK